LAISRDSESLTAAKQVLIDNWNFLRGDGQERWAYLFDEGLVDTATAEQWADEVWICGEAEEE
jgi:hypothetical protein